MIESVHSSGENVTTTQELLRHLHIDYHSRDLRSVGDKAEAGSAEQDGLGHTERRSRETISIRSRFRY